jgi:hypothetical protein
VQKPKAEILEELFHPDTFVCCMLIYENERTAVHLIVMIIRNVKISAVSVFVVIDKASNEFTIHLTNDSHIAQICLLEST